MLVARSLHLLAKRAGVAWAARPFVYALNASAAAIDAHVPSLREKRPGALFANFHVTAVKRAVYGAAAAIFVKAANAGFFAPRAVMSPDCHPSRFGSSFSRNHTIMSMRGFLRAIANACFR